MSDAAHLLAGVSGEELINFSDADLDELGLPRSFRTYLREQLLAPARSRQQSEEPVSVEQQLQAAEHSKHAVRRHLAEQKGRTRAGAVAT